MTELEVIERRLSRLEGEVSALKQAIPGHEVPDDPSGAEHCMLDAIGVIKGKRPFDVDECLKHTKYAYTRELAEGTQL